MLHALTRIFQTVSITVCGNWLCTRAEPETVRPFLQGSIRPLCLAAPGNTITAAGVPAQSSPTITRESCRRWSALQNGKQVGGLCALFRKSISPYCCIAKVSAPGSLPYIPAAYHAFFRTSTSRQLHTITNIPSQWRTACSTSAWGQCTTVLQRRQRK